VEYFAFNLSDFLFCYMPLTQVLLPLIFNTVSIAYAMIITEVTYDNGVCLGVSVD